MQAARPAPEPQPMMALSPEFNWLDNFDKISPQPAGPRPGPIYRIDRALWGPCTLVGRAPFKMRGPSRTSGIRPRAIPFMIFVGSS